MNAEAVGAIRLPTRSRGRQSAEKEAKYEADLGQFAACILEIRSTLDFTPSSRGWAYILENEAGLLKSQFGAAQDIVNECRKRGILPLDITCRDTAREFYNLEYITDQTPEQYAEALLREAHAQAEEYANESFWEDQDYYLQMLVEKIDLRELFRPVCADFRLPIANARGWSDLHTRADMMRRFGDWEAEGKQPVLLYCGDFDPSGMLISDTLMNQMKELERCVDRDPSGVIIDRFGLNLDFIESNALSWVDNLITGSGKNLADPKHRDHQKEHVQRWLREIGERKVEANALVTRPQAGRQLCHDAITRYVGPDAPELYGDQMRTGQDEVRSSLDRMVPEAPWKSG